MFPALINVPVVLNVGISQTASVQPDPIGTYYGVRLFYARSGTAATVAQIAADISKIRVNLNGTTQWELTGAELQAVLGWHGMNPDNGEIPLWFHEPFRKEERVQDFRSWGMVGIDAFTIEVDIGATAVAPTLTALRYWDPRPTVMGEIKKFKRANVATPNTGDNVVTNMPRNDRILNLHWNSTAITNWRVKANNFEFYNHAPSRMHSLAKEYMFPSAAVAQTGWSHMAFDFRGRGDVLGGSYIDSLDAFIPRNSQDAYGVTDGKGSWPYQALLPLEITVTTTSGSSINVVRELSGPRE